jgi:UDPglucose 6-dehydrogenase
LPIHEPGLAAVVRIARDGGRARQHSNTFLHSSTSTLLPPGTLIRERNLFFSTDSAACIGEADVLLLAVNTPTKYSGRGAGAASDLAALEGATRDIARFAKNGAIIVEKSTVPCGTANTISEIVSSSGCFITALTTCKLSSLRQNETFPILSNPEFLAEGSAIKNLLHPDRVLIGSAPTVEGRLAATRLAGLYGAWVPEDRIIHTNVASSELAKLVANAMLAQRISSINSISALCEKTGADVREIAKAVGTDDRIGSKFLKSGLGFGGSCFRKDLASLVYIAESLHLPEVADYWRSVLTMNMFQRQRFSDKIISKSNNTLSGKKIALLGFAYKKDTGDTRESLAVDIISSLLPERPLEIAIFDPCCPKAGIEREVSNLHGAAERIKIYSDPYSACLNASTVAILTEWDFFKADLPSSVLGKTTSSTAQKNVSIAEAPLEAYSPPVLPRCSPNCEQCISEESISFADSNQRLDWARVSKHMKHPRYVLDGRGILNERVMKTFGVELEGLGWVGTTLGQAVW